MRFPCKTFLTGLFFYYKIMVNTMFDEMVRIYKDPTIDTKYIFTPFTLMDYIVIFYYSISFKKKQQL